MTDCPRVPNVFCNGARIAYDDAGAGDPPIVLVHGGAFCDRLHMAPLFDHFLRRHRVVSMDLRGHGDSDRVGPISNEQFADDIAALCHESDIHVPVVIGHSTGGHAALELAGRHPGLAAAIVLLDIGPMAWEGARAEANRGLAKALRGANGSEVLAMVAAAMLPESEPFAARPQILDRASSASPAVFAELIENDLAWDGAAAASRCAPRTPVLAVVSDHPLLDVDDFTRRCPHAMLGRTVGSGHFHQLVVPAQVIAMVERFMDVKGLRDRVHGQRTA